MHIYIYDAEAGHRGSETRQINEKKKDEGKPSRVSWRISDDHKQHAMHAAAMIIPSDGEKKYCCMQDYLFPNVIIFSFGSRRNSRRRNRHRICCYRMLRECCRSQKSILRSLMLLLSHSIAGSLNTMNKSNGLLFAHTNHKIHFTCKNHNNKNIASATFHHSSMEIFYQNWAQPEMFGTAES